MLRRKTFWTSSVGRSSSGERLSCERDCDCGGGGGGGGTVFLGLRLVWIGVEG